MDITNALGFIGATLLLWAFVQSSRNKWHGNSKAYQVVNLVAGITLAFYTYDKGAYFATFINVVWAVVAMVGYSRLRRHKGKK